MKKLLFIFLIAPLNLFLVNAQWIPQGSGFSSAVSVLPLQMVPVNQQVAWSIGTSLDLQNNAIQGTEFVRTTDGGITWKDTTAGVPETFAWSCLASINADTAWGIFYDASVGAGGGIYRTDDGGTTWNQQGAYDENSFPDIVYFWDANNGVTVGDPNGGYFEIYTTNDGGITWTRVVSDSIPAPLSSAEFGYTADFTVYNGIIWFGTSSGRVYKSTNRGASWTVLTTTGLPQAQRVVFTDEEHGFTTYFNSALGLTTVKRTLDGGATWATIPVPDNFYLSDISYVPGTDNALVSTGINQSQSAIGTSYSLDYGDTWVTVDTVSPIQSMRFFDPKTGYGAGYTTDFSASLMYTYGGSFVATGIHDINSSAFQLNTYPNPGNGLFYISFDTDNYQPITVTVTDALGKIVYVNSYKDKSQLWLRTIDLRNMSKGMYILTVENNGDKAVRKLIIQ